MQFTGQLCLFTYHFKQFFMKLANQNFAFVRIFTFKKTTNFLFTLQAWPFAFTSLQKVLNCILLFCIWIAWWTKTPIGSLKHFPIPTSCYQLFFQIILEKITQTLQIDCWRNSNPSFLSKHRKNEECIHMST